MVSGDLVAVWVSHGIVSGLSIVCSSAVLSDTGLMTVCRVVVLLRVCLSVCGAGNKGKAQ